MIRDGGTFIQRFAPSTNKSANLIQESRKAAATTTSTMTMTTKQPKSANVNESVYVIVSTFATISWF